MVEVLLFGLLVGAAITLLVSRLMGVVLTLIWVAAWALFVGMSWS